MLILRRIKIRQHERGLLFEDREFRRLLDPGYHWVWGLFWKIRIERVSVREVDFCHRDLEVIVRSGALEGQAEVLDLGDAERALVWIDGRFRQLLGPGLHALWNVFHEVRVELVDAGQVRLEHEALALVRREETAAMRSQANTAKILESNPMLLKLKELEVLEKVAAEANLNVMLTETGLSERDIKLV